MQKERCYFAGDCEFRNKCACGGNDHQRCHTSYHVGGIFFVDKEPHPTCIAKSYFGDAHLCLCPAKPSPR